MVREVAATMLLLTSTHTGACLIEDTRFLERTYDSELAALDDLKARYREFSIRDDVEFVGALYSVGSHIVASVGRGCPGVDGFTIRLRVPPEHQLLAFWHTHGAPGPNRDRFSRLDAAAVDAHGLPFYLITPRGELRVLHRGEMAKQAGPGVGHSGPPQDGPDSQGATLATRR